MAREKISFRSSVVIEAVAPVAVRAQNPLDFTGDGATSTFKAFDPGKDEVFSVLEASGETIWSVTNAGRFVIGDDVEATQNDGTILSGTLTGVDSVAGTITSDTALTDSAAAGNRVRVRLVAQVTMTEFGTPDLNTEDWGFEGTLSSSALDLDQEVDIEVTFIGAVAGGLDAFGVICAVVKPVEECE